MEVRDQPGQNVRDSHSTNELLVVAPMILAIQEALSGRSCVCLRLPEADT
jgi:hypothetical protein